MTVHTSLGLMMLALGILAIAFREGIAWGSTSAKSVPHRSAHERWRIITASAAILTLSATAVGFSIIRELYSAELASQHVRLNELVQSRIRVIEAVARFDRQHSQDVPGGARAATLGQLLDADDESSGFGRTGEFTLAMREGSHIRFLAGAPNIGSDSIERVALGEARAEPMQRALAGESGTLTGIDYRGVVVVAAYAPIPSLGVGLVAKIDLAEIQAPFLRSAFLASGIALIIVVMGVGATIVSIGPLVRRVETQALNMQIANAELRRVQDDLLKREALLNRTGRMAKVGGWEVDAETLEVTWTEETYRILEIPTNQKPSLQQALDFYTAEDRPTVETALTRALRHGEPWDMEARITTGTGKRLWTRSIGTPITVDGKTVKLTGTFQDITAHKRQQRAILMNQRIANVFLTSPDKDTYTGVLDVIIEGLESPLGFFGYVDDAGDLVCPSLTHNVGDQCDVSDDNSIFYHSDWGGAWGESLRQMRTVMTNEGLQAPSWHVPLECSLVVPIVHMDTLIGQFAVANKAGGYSEHDQELLESAAQQTAPVLHARLEEARRHREHEKLQEQFRQAQRMEAVGQLAGGVAHDFNNLLQVIQGYGEIALQESEPETPVRSPVQEMLRASERAKKLVAQLLAFSRRQVLDIQDVDLNGVIADVVEMLRRIIGEHIRLDIFPGHNLGIVRADRGQLEQVLMNLCVNARDAMPDGGIITIEVENVRIDDEYADSHPESRPGRYALLSVTDTGCGMDDAVLKNIFEPFFTTKELGEGTGLGLATVYGLVKQHGGMINAYSEVGRGTTFKIYLPLSERSATEIGTKIAGPAPGGTETILVAEDDDMILQLTKGVLERAGYTVLTARNGELALEVLKEHANTINLALLDVVMPKLGGRAVLERIREAYPRIRVLFASGYSSHAIHTNFVLEEGLELLPKPHSQGDLLRKVREVLDRTGQPAPFS